MKKIVLFVLVLSLVIPTILIFPGNTALACGEREPVTLLALVRQSKTIHIATYRGQEEGEIKTDEDEETKYREIKRNFDVTSTLKGETAKFVSIPNREYIWDDPSGNVAITEQPQTESIPAGEAEKPEKIEEHPVTEPEVVDESEGYDEEGYKPLSVGDTVILFLKTNEETKEIEATDFVDGIKNLSPADIAVYEARINEIKPILAAKKPNTEKILDWLVRLTEDPVTRWDGAYELEMSFFALEQRTAMENERKETPKKDDEPVDEIPYNNETLDTGLSTLYASKLNEYHKQTLTNIMVQSRYRNAKNKAGSDGLVNGDRELMRIVARWADEQVASVFVDQIRSGEFSTYDTASLMIHVSTILGDKQLGTLAEKFEEISFRDDDEEIETAKPAVNMEVANRENGAFPEGVTPETQPVTGKAANKPDPKKPAVTYKRIRDELTSKFLKRADAIMADNQVRAAK